MRDRRIRQDAVAEIENKRPGRKCRQDRIDRPIERRAAGQKHQRIEIALNRAQWLNVLADKTKVGRPINADGVDGDGIEEARQVPMPRRAESR